jgi:hypothetical protein
VPLWTRKIAAVSNVHKFDIAVLALKWKPASFYSELILGLLGFLMFVDGLNRGERVFEKITGLFHLGSPHDYHVNIVDGGKLKITNFGLRPMT